MAKHLGGEVGKTGLREYGATTASITNQETPLFAGQPSTQTTWMSHGDQVQSAPPGFEVLASTDATTVAAFGSLERQMFGVQWHPEVKHSEHGQAVLENFLHTIAGLDSDWNSGNVIAAGVQSIANQVGGDVVICALSGGVDSAVAAALVHEAVGDQLV
jgi:GMP synthase (glutamine-hydrolysing)